MTPEQIRTDFEDTDPQHAPLQPVLIELAAQVAEQTALMRQILEFWSKHHDLQVEALRLQREQIEKMDLRYRLSQLANNPQEKKPDEK
jgi:hypothetical protein